MEESGGMMWKVWVVHTTAYDSAGNTWGRVDSVWDNEADAEKRSKDIVRWPDYPYGWDVSEFEVNRAGQETEFSDG